MMGLFCSAWVLSLTLICALLLYMFRLIAAMTEPPPSYETVMAQPAPSSPISSNGTLNLIKTESPRQHLEGTSLPNDEVQIRHFISLPASLRTSPQDSVTNIVPPILLIDHDDETLAETTTHDWTLGDDSDVVIHQSGECSGSLSSSDSVSSSSEPPTYEEYLRASQLLNAVPSRPPPPSFTSLALSEPDLCHRVSLLTSGQRERASSNDPSMRVRAIIASHCAKNSSQSNRREVGAHRTGLSSDLSGVQTVPSESDMQEVIADAPPPDHNCDNRSSNNELPLVSVSL